PLRGSMGCNRCDLADRALRRVSGFRITAFGPLPCSIRWMGASFASVPAVRNYGTGYGQLCRAVAIRESHRNFVPGAPGDRSLLDNSLGSRWVSSLHAAHGLSGRVGTPYPAILISAHFAWR